MSQRKRCHRCGQIRDIMNGRSICIACRETRSRHGRKRYRTPKHKAGKPR